MLSSNGERIIHDILKDNDIQFEEEYTFNDLFSTSHRKLRFDFAVFDDLGDLDYLIEYQGQQHYAPNGKFGGINALRRQCSNDNAKRKYCILNNIPLIEIPYTDEKKLSLEYILSAYENVVCRKE